MQSIQTDNAMMFKGTNFVKAGSFKEFLQNLNIRHTFIPLGQPECNGCIERYHLTIDKELHETLMKCYTVAEVKQAFVDYIDYFNNRRYHTYGELKNLPYHERIMIPKDSINVLMSYNQTEVV